MSAPKLITSLATSLTTPCSTLLHDNQLQHRFKALLNSADSMAAGSASSLSPFTLVTIGFGNGLNLIAIWQCWQSIVAKHQGLLIHNKAIFSVLNDNAISSMLNKAVTTTRSVDNRPSPRLHIICMEPSPLSPADLRRSLTRCQQHDAALSPFVSQILLLYPTLVSGCHRLHLSDAVTLDLWFGDIVTNLAKLDNASGATVDAWCLDIRDATNAKNATKDCDNRLYSSLTYSSLTDPSYCTPPVVAQVRRLSKPSTSYVINASDTAIPLSLVQAGFAIETVEDFADNIQIVQGRFTPFSTAIHKVLSQTAYHQQQKIPMSQCCRSDENNLVDPVDPVSYVGHVDSPLVDSSLIDLPLAAVVAGAHIAIVGAGVSGLMAAWALAKRGMHVTLFDKLAPLAGASGNPRALLAPKMVPITQVAEHLHSIGYLYSQRLYRQLNTQLDKPVFEPTALLDLLCNASTDSAKIDPYPKEMAVMLNPHHAHALTGLEQHDLQHSVYLPQSGLVNPKALADTITAHPNITVMAATIKHISSQAPRQQSVTLSVSKSGEDGILVEQQIQFDAVVIAAAYHSQALDPRIFDFRKIRGQLSWFEPSAQQLKALPKIPLKYNGYCALFVPQPGDDRQNPIIPHQPTFLLGASFVRNDTDTAIRPCEHQVSLDKLLTAVPAMRDILANLQDDRISNDKTSTDTNTNTDIDTLGWQARVSIRAQTPDYHPLVGQVDKHGLIWTLSGMGSKGFAFAPLCAEVLADKMTGQFSPLSAALLTKLDPKRKSLQTALTG